jgi:glutamyl-tRNA synthetase
MDKKELQIKTKAYALKNAIAYNGKVNQGSVLSSLFHEGLKKEEVRKYFREINKIINEINKLSLDEQKKEFEKIEKEISKRKVREGLPELPGAKKGKVVMRFAPSPSGAFHIGSALTACISFLFVRKYGGKFYVRVEDTNPENIYPPAYKLIKKDSDWLFGKEEEIVIQSERMKIYYSYTEKIIRKNSAYVCTCDNEKFKELIRERKECPCRNLSVKDNLERWKKMLDKNGYKPGEAVLRFKGNIKNKNPAMRDFPLARINETPHPLQKKKYRVWPLMNLAVTADDIEEKMTHTIRAKDHRDNAQRQKMIYKVLGVEKKYPWTAFLGRWHIKGMRLSASEITRGIREGKYSGWDDVKLPTVSALRKKGYKPEAFWKFAERIGLSEADKIIDRKEFFKLLDHFNRNI